MTDLKLSEHDVPRDPFEQFDRWFRDVEKAEFVEPRAMAVATVDDQGRPSSRMVLLKNHDPDGFTFYTNYGSRKARELDHAGRAALLFYWDRLHRQVRIEGTVERVGASESDAYFATRARGSQIGAWASPQSETLPDRRALEAKVVETDARYAGQTVPRPPHWGGYRVKPEAFEFWQGRESRLHDRIVYRADGRGGWTITRLAP